MSKLLRANLVRLGKTKAFWIGMAVMVCYSLLISQDTVSAIEKFSREADAVDFYQMMFTPLLVFGFVTAVVCSLFVGVEHGDGVIRNKIVTGQKRSAVYLADFFTCALLSVIIFLVTVATGAVFGIFTIGTEGVDWLYVLTLTATGGILVMVYAAFYNFISLLNANKTHGVILNIMLFLFFTLFASFLFSTLSEPEFYELPTSVMITEGENQKVITEVMENPYYLTGIQRDIYQFLFDFLPGGQMYQLASAEMEKPGILMLYSGILLVIVNVGGVLLFKRKDLK